MDDTATVFFVRLFFAVAVFGLGAFVFYDSETPRAYCTYVFANQPTAADTLAVVMADSTAFCERFLR